MGSSFSRIRMRSPARVQPESSKPRARRVLPAAAMAASLARVASTEDAQVLEIEVKAVTSRWRVVQAL
jgi:hypothetical protein